MCCGLCERQSLSLGLLYIDGERYTYSMYIRGLHLWDLGRCTVLCSSLSSSSSDGGSGCRSPSFFLRACPGTSDSHSAKRLSAMMQRYCTSDGEQGTLFRLFLRAAGSYDRWSVSVITFGCIYDSRRTYDDRVKLQRLPQRQRHRTPRRRRTEFDVSAPPCEYKQQFETLTARSDFRVCERV